MKYKVELTTEREDGSWWADVEVEADNAEEAGKKAKDMSSHIEFYQILYGPDPSRVTVQQVYPPQE